jgi:DNA-binding IclR family transcriptional regulator
MYPQVSTARPDPQAVRAYSQGSRSAQDSSPAGERSSRSAAAAEQVVKSAGRTLEIFEFLANRGAPAGIADIAGALGYPRSSTSVLVASLVKLGYLVQDLGTRKFRPSLRLAFLGSWLETPSRLQGRLERLAQQTGETVIVAQRVQLEVQYIQVLTSPDDCRQRVGIGTRRPLVQAATGQVLLADLPDREIGLLLRRSNALSGSEAMIDLESLIQAVASIRQMGYAVGRSRHVPTHSYVVARAPELPDQPPLAIGIAGPTQRFEQHLPGILRALDEAGVQMPMRC